MRSTALILSACLCTLLACSEPKADYPYFKEVAGVRLLMVSVLDPSADYIWDSVKTIITLEGTEEFRPETEEEWVAVRNQAIVLAEAGNLLMIGSRARDQQNWIAWSQDMTDAAEKVMHAAEARDADRIFDLGEDIYLACAGCHEQYWRSDFVAPQESGFAEKTAEQSDS